MATAQSLVVQGLIDLINSNGNINAEVIASSPSAGYIRVTARAAGTPSIGYLAGGSSVTGAGTFVSYPSTGSPKYAELAVSWTLAPGDTVKINVGDGVRSVDMTYNLPLNTVVDPGGFDHSTAAGGGGGAGAGAGGVIVGGSGVASAQHRRLVVVEAGSASASFGSMFALDPQDATGVAIPTFRVTNSLPAAGSALGQALYITATRQGYVWDGTDWRDITASPIRAFPNDAALQANTTEALGTYAVATDTGNLYVRTPDGWRRIGITEFSTYNDLISYAAPTGSEAVANDIDVLFLRVLEAGVPEWKPISVMAKDEATILATQNIAGLQAVATDTGRTYVNDGTRWIEQPIRHYDTQAELLAATPPDGTLAWADDTGNVFTWATGKGWIGLNTGQDDPIPVGAMMDFPTRAIPNGWLECNGQTIPADVKFDDLRALLGTTSVPDLRGYFSRAAIDGQGLLDKKAWTTGRSRTALTGTTNTTGNHTHVYQRAVTGIDQGVNNYSANNNDGGQVRTNSEGAGNHNHTVSINGGGDSETAPDHYTSVRCIKAFHITASLPGPDRLLTAFVAPAQGQTISYDVATGSWANESKGIVGSIVQSMLTEAQFAVLAGNDAVNWVLADGRDVTGSLYAQVTMNNAVPDLRGAFIRGAGQNQNNQANWNGGAVGSWHNDTTRRPRNTAFTTSTAGDHTHNFDRSASQGTNDFTNWDMITVGRNSGGSHWSANGNPGMQGAGAHTHTITGGGDAETRPKSYSVNYYIKIN